MRVVILGMCGLVAGGVFAIMFLAIWNSRRASDHGQHFPPSAMTEFLWVAISCLMVIAAVTPAVIAIVAPPAGN